jgi:thiamine-phosphate pyrophosphorylase
VNYNRLNESLKLIEDIVRFSLEDSKLLISVRDIRERFLRVKKRLPLSLVIQERASNRDLGRSIGFDRRTKRTDKEMIIANMTRAKEAARILEEVLKIQDSRSSAMVKDIRFQLYDLERVLYGKLDRDFDPSIYAILDEKYIHTSRLERDIRCLVRYGVTMLQLRIKSLSDRKFLHHAKKIMKLLAVTKVRFIINNRIDIALACGAHGVHLGQRDIPTRQARDIFGEHHIIGVSAHTPAQARQAEQDGADYLGVGSIYPTATKEDARVIGLKGLRDVCKAVTISVIGIGGINGKNYKPVLKAGADGIAISSFLFQGPLEKRMRALTGRRR